MRFGGFRRKRDDVEPPAIEPVAHAIPKPAAAQVPFGYKTAWLAVRSTSTKVLADAIGLEAPDLRLIAVAQ